MKKRNKIAKDLHSLKYRKRVIKSRDIQEKRYIEDEMVHSNAQMGSKQIQKFCNLDKESREMLKMAMEKLNLSARAYDRILKVSRTISDLSNSENIEIQYIAEAIQYRSLDREGWAG